MRLCKSQVLVHFQVFYLQRKIFDQCLLKEMPNLNENNYVSIGLRKINQLEISIPPNNASSLVANSTAAFQSSNQKNVEKVVESAILKAIKFFQKNPLEKGLLG